MSSGVEATVIQLVNQRGAELNQDRQGKQLTEDELDELDVPEALVNMGDEDLIVSWLRQQEIED